MEANIFSIEEFSIYDGPGIRTTVFLKGCPLRCLWCHNPEGQTFEPQIVRSPNGCTKCGNCTKYALCENGKITYTDDSIKNCPMHLLRVSGEAMTPSQLFEKIIKNAPMLTDGGITFSGGEPLAHPEFLAECMSLFKGKLHIALQTSGYAKPKVFNKILPLCDLVLFDLKIINEEKHIKYTGCSNGDILTNFKTLAASGTQFTVRVPLIPTVTDTEENIRDICRIMKENGAAYAELLPYNKMAGSKYALVGREYNPDFNDKLDSCIRPEIWAENGIEIKVL